VPDKRVHRRICLEWLGQYTEELHRIMDAPASKLRSVHRTLFHDWDFVEYVWKKLGKKAAMEVLLHITLDLEQYRPEEEKLIKTKRLK